MEWGFDNQYRYDIYDVKWYIIHKPYHDYTVLVMETSETILISGQSNQNQCSNV